jgi:hypothetical protein
MVEAGKQGEQSGLSLRCRAMGKGKVNYSSWAEMTFLYRSAFSFVQKA